MADLEDDLRRVLHDPARALPPWPDAVQRVRAGMRLRHSGRVLARIWMGVTVMVATLSVTLGPAVVTGDRRPSPVPTSSPSPIPSPQVVPWLDLPFADRPDVPVSPRPVRAACRFGDLDQVPVSDGGALGTVSHVIRVRNDGPSACTLSNRPVVRGKRQGTVQTITPNPAGDDLVAPGAVPATIEPDEYADVVIFTYGGCLDGRPETVYTAIRIEFAGGIMPLGEDLNTTCGVGMSVWHRLEPDPPTFAHGLQARISNIGPARYDEALTFIVTLVNTTPSPTVLDPCPNYVIAIASVNQAGDVHGLNCLGRLQQPRTIPPGGSLDFAMQTWLPPDPGVDAGPIELTWSLDGGARASATFTIAR